MKFIKRLAAFGVAQFVIVAAAVLFLSGTQMGATELPSSSAEPPTETEVLDAVFDETTFAGAFVGNGPFTINGEAVTITDDLGQRRLILTDTFQTNRGQDLVLFLRSDSGERIRLDILQAVSGAQSYVIPGPLDLNRFNEVQIRDVAFDVHFGSAFLSPVEAP